LVGFRRATGFFLAAVRLAFFLAARAFFFLAMIALL
jgi:hypothetical protein